MAKRQKICHSKPMSGKVPGQDLPAQINIPSETDALPVTAHRHSQTATNESSEKSAEPSKSNLTDDVPMPNLSAQIVFPSGSIVTAKGHPHVNESPVQSESGDSTCDQIPESPCSQTNVALGTNPYCTCTFKRSSCKARVVYAV